MILSPDRKVKLVYEVYFVSLHHRRGRGVGSRVAWVELGLDLLT